MTFARERAREALYDAHPTDWLPTEQWIDDLLNELEECSQFDGWAALWRILDETYPEWMFPEYVEADHGNGPQVVSLLRLLGRAEARLAGIAALCDTADATIPWTEQSVISASDVRKAISYDPSTPTVSGAPE